MNRADKGVHCLLSMLSVCLLVLIIIGGPGCRKEAPPAGEPTSEPTARTISPSTPGTPAQGTISPPAEPDKTVVTVNGRDIGQREMDRRIVMAMRQFGSKLATLPEAFKAQVQNQIKQQVVDNLIAERLLDEQVKAAHIEITDEQVLAEMANTGAQQAPPITVEEFRARVEAQGGNFEDVKEEFRRGMSYRRVMEGQWAGKTDVTDEEAKQYYDSHVKEFQTPEQVQASHILIAPKTTDPNADPNEAKAVAKEQAEKLLAEIKGGADFAALAKEHSSCPSSEKGGDLGLFARGAMVKPFEDTAFAMQPGQVSSVVETKFGYHIIKLTDRKDATTVAFDEAKAGIVAKLADEKKATISKQYLQSLKDKAKIVYPPNDVPDANQPAAVNS